MKNLNLSEKNFDYIRGLLKKDAEEIAIDISFFEQLNLNPREYIDERILLCKEFELDFWNCISDNCSDYQTKQLKAIYEEVNIAEFAEKYEISSQNELAKDFLKMIVRNRNEKLR